MGCSRCEPFRDFIVEVKRGQPGLIQRRFLNSLYTVSGFPMPLATNELEVATFHLQGEAVHHRNPEAEIKFDISVTTSPFVIDETLAVAACQGLVNSLLGPPSWSFAATGRERFRVHFHGATPVDAQRKSPDASGSSGHDPDPL